MSRQSDPIGVFDSGVGGLSVLKAMTALLPEENFLYYGDSKNAPYGTKSAEEVQALSLSIAEYLLEQGAKALVVACNTATSVSIALLREKYASIPVIGIEPALKPAALSLPHPRVLVLATPMTIREEKFHDLFVRFDDEAEITTLPCPEMVELVEQGKLSDPQTDAIIAEKLAPYDGKADAVVLGCTHFPFLKASIRKAFKTPVTLYDGAEGTARELKKQLLAHGILKNDGQSGTVRIENSLGAAEAAFSRELFSQFTI
jgi:glutamate racemase